MAGWQDARHSSIKHDSHTHTMAKGRIAEKTSLTAIWKQLHVSQIEDPSEMTQVQEVES